MAPRTQVSHDLYGAAEHEQIRTFLLQVMNEAGVQVEHTVRELQERAHPAVWALVEDCIKATSVTGRHTLLELLQAIHPGIVNVRKHERVPTQVRCLVATAARDRIGGGRIGELSPGGCRLECDLALAPSTAVRLEVLLPQGAGVVTIDRAVVRWACGQRLGVEFVSLRHGDAARLQRYLDRARSVL